MPRMSLESGTRLGPYEVVAPLGAGGMGEVYRARDTRLDRIVAIKVLPEAVTTDRAFRERFEREARAASALNHPNILSVFDVGRERDVDYLVTELVDGVTLRDRMGAKSLPLREVVAIGAQIADGLSAAHAARLVHRDLKPENLMLTADGRVKILDFGLAKSLSGSAPAQQTRTDISHGGLLVGTVGYISPEQVRGGPGDARSDLFALGVVLYEMVSGRRAFSRPTSIETLNAVLKEDPPELDATTPDGLRQIVGHCLEKDPARRFQSSADVAFALRSLAGTSTTTMRKPDGTSSTAPRLLRLAGAVGAAAILAVAGYMAGRTVVSAAIPLEAIEFVPYAVEAPGEYAPAISPDGRSVVYIRSTGESFDIVVKSDSAPAPTVLLRDHPSVRSPFWSPDGDRVYFEAGSRLRSIATLGGDVGDEIDGVNGVHLAPDGATFAAIRPKTVGTREAQLYVGTRHDMRPYEPALSVPSDCVPNHVRFSPDGSRILLWLACGGSGIIIVPTPGPAGRGGPPRRLWEGQIDAFPQGVSWLEDSRHLVLALRDSLWLGDTEGGSLTRLTTTTSPLRLPAAGPGNTIAFTEWVDDYDLVEFPLSGGSPRPVVNSTRYDGSGVWSARGGRLAYVANRDRGDEIWLRSGDTLSDRRLLTSDDFTGSRPEFIRALTFSPDGQWLAFTAFSLQPSLDSAVWVIPIGGGTPRRVSSKDVLVMRGTWSPDGRQMALYGLRNGSAELWTTSIGGSESRQVALPDGLGIREMEWSPTGESIAALEFRSDGPRPTVLIDPSNGGITRVPGLTAAVLTWSRDGKRLYGLGAGVNGSELREMEIASGAVRTVAAYDSHLHVTDGSGNGRRLTLSPDGRSLLTTVYTNRSNVWLLKGLRLPRRGWWPFN